MKIGMLLFLILSITVYSQPSKLNLYGYFQNDSYYGKSHSSEYSLILSKFQLCFNKDLSENSYFEVSVNYYHYDGKKEYEMGSFFPKQFTNSLKGHHIQYDNESEIHNLFTRMSFGNFDVLLGKQQISLGSGYSVNPIDIFNRKDLTDPSYEQKGHEALRIDFTAGLLSTISMIVSPEEELKKTELMILSKNSISNYDITFSYGRNYQAVDYDFSHYQEVTKKASHIGFSAVGQLWKPGIWFEGVYHVLDNWNDYYEWIGGLDYTFDCQVYVMSEFFYKSCGKTKKQDYKLADWFLYYNGSSLGFIKNQMTILFSFPFQDLFTFTQTAVYSFSDKSWLMIPEIKYNIFPNIDILLRGIIYQGDDGKYFSSELGHSVLFRMVLYY